MKSGLVINAFVLAAFHAVGGHPGPLAALITADEEIASPSSRPIIEQAARGARVVLNGEPGRPSGNVVNGRKGCVFIRFSIAGLAAHSGGNFFEGRSAIGELAHKIIALHALTDAERGVTVNVGLAVGGQSVNTVAPNASGEIDLRYVHPADRARALEQIGAILERPVIAGTQASWQIAGEFCPMEMTPQSRRLLEFYCSVSAGQGVEVGGEFTGGCADSGLPRRRARLRCAGLGPLAARFTPRKSMWRCLRCWRGRRRWPSWLPGLAKPGFRSRLIRPAWPLHRVLQRAVPDAPEGEGAECGDDDRFRRRPGAAHRQAPSPAQWPGEPQALRGEHVGRQVGKIADRDGRRCCPGGARMGQQRSQGEESDGGMSHAAMPQHCAHHRRDGTRPAPDPGFRLIQIGQQCAAHRQRKLPHIEGRQVQRRRGEHPGGGAHQKVGSRHHAE